MHAQDQYRQLGPQLLDFAQHFPPAATRHSDIEDHDIPFLIRDPSQRLVGISSFTKRSVLKVIGQDKLQALSNESMVINEQDFHDLGLVSFSALAAAECGRTQW